MLNVGSRDVNDELISILMEKSTSKTLFFSLMSVSGRRSYKRILNALTARLGCGDGEKETRLNQPEESSDVTKNNCEFVVDLVIYSVKTAKRCEKGM